MTIQEFTSKLNDDLRSYLKTRSHIDSGKLYNSINFKMSNSNELTLDAEEYIVYLDDGKFLPSYLNSDSFNNILNQYLLEKFK